MALRLGINDCFAVKRWPHPADWAPIVRERLGLSLVQHSLDLVDLDVEASLRAAQAEAVVAAARTHGLQIHSTFTGLAAYSRNLLLDPDPAARRAADAWYRRAIEFTTAIGAGGTGGHVGAFGVADWQDPARRAAAWGALRASLDSLAAAAGALGQSFLLVENLAAAREPSTMAMVRELLRDGGLDRAAIRLCLDVGHMCVPGTTGRDRDPYAWLRDLGPMAPVVQLQQSDAEGDHHWPFTTERNAAGRIDADAVLDALAEGGVEETALILEVIPPFEQDDAAVLDDLEASVTYWRDALARRGLAS